MPGEFRVGTAGWGLPASHRAVFSPAGSQLERYAGRFMAVEINSSFYRPHRRSTYERWAASVPEGFRFAVKLPKAITHEQRLVDCAAALDRFAEEVGGLGRACGPLLVQLPPSLGFDRPVAERFFEQLTARTKGAVACEPRHAGWFTAEADACMAAHRIARVAADPAPVPDAEHPGGWDGLVYLRLHGSPKIYYSDYDAPSLAAIEARLHAYGPTGRPVWCIFDNTALGHATGNALMLAEALEAMMPARTET